MVVGRVFRDQHDTGNAVCRVGVLLEGGVPEIFRKMLLASGKADRGRPGVPCEGERKRDLDRRAVGPLALALEMHGVGDTDLSRTKRGGIRDRIAALKEEERQPFVALEKDAIEG